MPLILICPRLRSAPSCVAPWRRLLARDADEDEDREGAERREDERGPARDADRQRAVIDVSAEADRPEEGDHAVVDRRGTRHVRHMQDSRQVPGSISRFDRAVLIGGFGTVGPAKPPRPPGRHRKRRRRRGGDFHKLQGVLWKCGKLNFCKLRPFRRLDLLRKDLTSPRFPFAPSTERK